MTCKQVVKTSIAICMAVILAITACGCEDLGAYEDTEDYYSSFGDVVLISGTSRDVEDYSIEEYFYNEESRENFLRDENGEYSGIEHSDYVYIAIPVESDIEIDSIALFMQSQSDVTVYISAFLTDKIPSNWKSIADNEIKQEENGEISEEEAEENEAETTEVEVTEAEAAEAEATETEATETEAAETEPTETEETEETETEETVYDDPDPQTSIGDIMVQLKKDEWGSFVLGSFNVNGKTQESIQINDGQYILLQIRNNSGVRIFDDEKQIFVDQKTGLELQKAEITMTNLLIRALNKTTGGETQGGE